MRCLVVGAGAWGLPAAAELAGRGHDVILLDRYGVANRLSSSPGPTRLWRLTHPDAVRVRLALRSVEAMERLASRSGRQTYLRRGLLWRDDVSLPAVLAALAEEGIAHQHVAAAEVARFFPGLRPDGRAAVWQAESGPVLAAASMAAQAALFEAAGGVTRIGPVVRAVEPRSQGVRVHCDTSGDTGATSGGDLDADVVVLAPGPGAGPLLASLGVDVPLRPRLEQVVHFGMPGAPGATDDLPCLFDGTAGAQPAMYTMPTPGVGYKVGLDRPLRDFVEGDDDRTPDAALVALAAERVRRDLTALDPTPLDVQVCTWTDAPDGRFVIDRLPGGIVVACGDSGEGFKFSALMGIVLADLAEGHAPDADIATFGLARFAGGVQHTAHVLGR
jgi:sarcosine oxidase